MGIACTRVVIYGAFSCTEEVYLGSETRCIRASTEVGVDTNITELSRSLIQAQVN